MIATGARRRVMWVDACRNEPGKGATDGRSFSRFESSSGTRILFSTKAGRISYEDDELKQGLFSYYLARGLHGDAARDDGMVSFRDLADFVVDGVESRSLTQGRVQVPYEAGESSGDFLLARANSGAALPITTSAPKPATIPATTAMVGRVNLSRFAGIAPGDSAQTVDAKYLRPQQTSESTQIHGASSNPGFGVSYEGGVVKGAGAFAHELTWIRVHGGDDPLLDLMGKSEAEVTAVLGPPTRQEGTGAYRNLYWGFPWKGQPAPASPNARSDATVTVEFNSGVCQFVGVRW